MANRKSTLDLSTLLTALAIDLKVELEILDFEEPTPADHHAALMAAWRLNETGVKASNVSVEEQRLIIVQRLDLKGTKGISFEYAMQFQADQGMTLVKTDVLVRGVTMANSKGWDFPHYYNQEKQALEFLDVDATMFATAPALMASFVHGVWRFIFNDSYSQDCVHMASMALDILKEKKDVFVNNMPYTTLEAHHINLTDYNNETIDLVGLAARLFLQNYPNNKDVSFMVGPTADREPQYVLCVEADEQ